MNTPMVSTLCLGLLCLSTSVSAQCDYDLIEPDAGHWTPVNFDHSNPWHGRIRAEGPWLAMNTDGERQGPDDPYEIPAIQIFRAAGDSWTHDAFIRDPQGQLAPSRFGFGEAFDFHEDRLAVTARDPGNGVVYIFERQAKSWEMVSMIPLSDAMTHSAPRDRTDVSLSEHGLLVTSTDKNGQRVIQYFIEDNLGEWSHTQSLTVDDETAEFRFGASLSVSGDRLATPSGSYDGQLLLYEWVDGVWEFQGSPDVDADVTMLSSLGISVALVESRLAAYTSNGSDVWIFEELESGSWSASMVDLPATAGNDIAMEGDFTYGLDFDGTTIAATRRAPDYDDSDSGALFIIRRANGAWNVEGAMRPGVVADEVLPGHAFPRGFGADVELRDEHALVPANLALISYDEPGKPCILSYDLNDDLGDDLDGNGICDHLDILNGGHDRDANHRVDSVEIVQGLVPDCDGNGIPDHADPDCDGDGIPDACEPDCNGNGVPDDCESVYIESDSNESPSMFWFLNTLAGHQVWLREVIVQAGHETVSELVFHRGSFHDTGTFEAVIYMDPTADNDPSDAELLLRVPIDLLSAGPRDGLVVSIPDTELGPAGTHLFLGLHVANASYRGNYAMSRGINSDLPPGVQTVWVYGNVSEPLDLDDLASAALALSDSVFTPSFEMHHGPRALCCPESDLNDDGATDIQDLSAIIAAWGPCDGCAEDIDQDGDVDVDDLLIVIRNWGDCL